MTILSIDFETYSTVNLKTAGVDVYAAHPDTGVWCMAWALADDPVSVWKPGDKDPHKVLDHIASGGTVAGWNLAFERAIWREVIARKFPTWPQLKLEQLDCTMARAYARALPGALAGAAEAVNLPIAKDREGQRVMMKLCVPTLASRKARKQAEADGAPLPAPEWERDPALHQKLHAYCRQDVEVERRLAKLIAPLTPRERKIWVLDQTINDRGVRVDRPKVEAALDMVEKEKKVLVKELKRITREHGKEVTTPNSNPQMLAWITDQGFFLPDLKKRKLQRFVANAKNNGLAERPHVLRVLQIRLQIAKASTAKLKAMLAGCGADDRVRGLFSYHVATTGRWAGRRVQLQNMPRPELKQKEIDEVIELLGQHRDADVIRICYAEPLPAVSSCLRGMIIPDAGNHLIGGDFAGIEGRVIAWLAGEDWKLGAYVALDEGTGADTYKLAYSRSFGVPVSEVTSDQRQIGKVQELALGFQGGVGAFLNMGDNYGVVPSEIARVVKGVTDVTTWEETLERYAKTTSALRYGLSPDDWTGLKIVVDAWRNAHPNTKNLWWDLADCAMRATLSPKEVFITETGRVKFLSNKQYLFCQLASGRVLSYAKPSVHDVPTGRLDRRGKPIIKQELRYFGQGKISRKWEQRRAYGGLLAENCTQATARDVLADSMLRAEDAGYTLVLHVHDEPVSEVPKHFGDPEEFRALMCASEKWLAGCPIAAEAWVKNRYGK